MTLPTNDIAAGDVYFALFFLVVEKAGVPGENYRP
jgi:hypothetical protein